MIDIEKKRNELNLELRRLLAVLDLVDGNNRKYPDYIEGSGMTEEEFINQQLMLVIDAKDRLVNVFKSE